MPLDEGFGRDRALGRQLLQVDPPGASVADRDFMQPPFRNRGEIVLPDRRRAGDRGPVPVQRIEAHEERAGPERPVAEPVRRVSLEMRRHGAGLAAGERLGDAGPFEEQGRLSDGPHDMHGEDLTRPSRVPCARQLSERGEEAEARPSARLRRGRPSAHRPTALRSERRPNKPSNPPEEPRSFPRGNRWSPA